jgi:hypothetical protein
MLQIDLAPSERAGPLAWSRERPTWRYRCLIFGKDGACPGGLLHSMAHVNLAHPCFRASRKTEEKHQNGTAL